MSSDSAERAAAISVPALMKLPAEDREARVREFEARVDYASTHLVGDGGSQVGREVESGSRPPVVTRTKV